MTTIWVDRLGGLASATCALHCLVVAAAPTLLSLTGLGVLVDESFEWGFFTLAIAFAVVAAFAGYRCHRTRWVLGGFGVGIATLLAGRAGEALHLYEGGAVLAVAGGAVLVASHVASLWQTRRCTGNCPTRGAS